MNPRSGPSLCGFSQNKKFLSIFQEIFAFPRVQSAQQTFQIEKKESVLSTSTGSLMLALVEG